MKLITQPEAGVRPLISAVRRARRTVDIVIFRFDLDPLEDALEAAVARGVVVRALIAHTNKGGENRLRKLEQRLLKAGVTVCRTNNDLVRYHGKLLTIDRRKVYILGFNYTTADIWSRSFAVVVRSPRIVKEALRLFDSDANRTNFVPRECDLVISPQNARQRLDKFIRRARVSLDIYDPQISDDRMLELLERKAAHGVRIRILGKLEAKWGKAGFDTRPFPGKRLHVRAIVRDGRRAFVGSQSLRKLELDGRREVGLLIRDRAVVHGIERTFRHDWNLTTHNGRKKPKGKEKLAPAVPPNPPDKVEKRKTGK